MSSMSHFVNHRPRRSLAAVAAVVALMLGAVGLGSLPSVAAESSTALVLRQADTTRPSESSLQFIYTGSPTDAADSQLEENGTVVESRSVGTLPASTPIAVALVFDTSEAMDTSGALVAAKEAAKNWVRSRSGGREANEIFGVYTASDVGVELQSFTSDTNRVDRGDRSGGAPECGGGSTAIRPLVGGRAGGRRPGGPTESPAQHRPDDGLERFGDPRGHPGGGERRRPVGRGHGVRGRAHGVRAQPGTDQRSGQERRWPRP